MSTTGYSASPYRKPQKQSDRLLSKSERCLRRAIRRRLAENLKNKAIASYGRVSAIALQKTSKIKRSPVVEVRSPCKKPQKLSDRLYGRVSVSLAENLKN
ncbi:MAG: hypothetical protein V7L14_23950 [Nostoc sp.]|uniref:hypothetical protein n=1 Tax=unclassified Nostoc TaxID=2593658 RepID=UPI0025EF5B60|nr:hypothetical protein [Nostoc sp. NOS(2021)]MBN3897632.1 hypothetical protein [Nostoc sp. NOS(2021)]